ncbi:DUF6268 family outer membrane beta-barrel protein [Jejudonia soesokkakensis]|uniref:DUF6268 family outer membrane beta-barrel protein n=1 Tax=Jejudonia soesokkakensis TaxID=1323432 RepID=A0ABW2MUM5_9FLAO
MIKITNLKYVLVVVTILMCSQHTYSQLTDLARIEYTYFPQDDSENTFKRFRVFANYPIQLSEDGYLVIGAEYRNVDLDLGDELPFIKDEIQEFSNYAATIGYTNTMKNDWRYAFQGELRLASNFTDGIVSEDYILGGSVYFIKDRTGDEENAPEKPWRLVLGLNYSTTAGRPFPLPFINYYREFATDWSFGLGVPKSNIKWEFVPNHELQGFVTLDGFFANIQEDLVVTQSNNDQDVGNNISMTTLLSGIGYSWEFIEHFEFYLYFGHTIINNIRIEDDKNNEVYTINDQNNFYGRTGIKLKI